MPVPDNGGWDLTVEIAANALAALIGGALPPAPPRQIQTNLASGTLTPQVRITGATLSATADLTVSLSTDGTMLRITQLTFPPGAGTPPALPVDVEIKATVRVTARLTMRSNALVVDFAPMPVLNQPLVVADVDDEVLLEPPFLILLAWAFANGGQAGLDQMRRLILDTLEDGLENGVRDAVTSLGTVVLVPAPTLPPPLAVTGSALLASPASLRVFYSVGGPAGNTSLVTRSMLLTSSVTGTPADAAALCISNACLLRDFVRTGLIAPPLALPAGGFLAGHPCLFVGPVPIPLPAGGIPGVAGATFDSLLAGTDEAGLLHLVASMTATGVGGSFTYRATVDASFAFSASASGGTLTLAFTPVTPPAVRSDVSIAAWVYVAAGLTGGAALVGVLAAVDAFAGAAVDGPIATAIGGALPTITLGIPLPSRLPALAVRTSSTAQPDSTRRSIPIGGISIPDPFRSHDIIVNLI